jgi:UDP-N-acetylmuramoyl-tripeptide--D-alanyl-D-alanine ligase
MMSLQQTCQILDGTLHGEDKSFTSVSIDTRSLQSGALYFALKGERFDGHEFIKQAQQSGAVAAVVSDVCNEDSLADLSQIKVSDTRKALGRLAAAWRKTFQGTVVGITGSNGKTTVKEMTAAILAKRGDVLATQGNFNNDIGLPLTLLRMDQNEEFAVIEMGANHHGEINELTHITNPDVALITNAGPAHLEGFGSLKGVAEAKGEIYSGLTAEGVAVINADDQFAEYWSDLCKNNKQYLFSLENTEVDVKGEWLPTPTGGLLKIKTGQGQCEINLSVIGQHNAMNALAATAVSLAAGATLNDVQAALAEFKAVKGRLNMHETNSGACIIDDTYNANPASLEAGLKVLASMPGEHWLVLGDMGELGENAERLHFDVGVKANESGVNRLYVTGENSIASVKAFGEHARHFETHEELIKFLKSNMHDNLNILIKGSRYMKMEQVVESLIGEDK